MTGYGLGGPMTATGSTIDPKDPPLIPQASGMTTLGVGSWILWLLLFR